MWNECGWWATVAGVASRNGYDTGARACFHVRKLAQRTVPWPAHRCGCVSGREAHDVHLCTFDILLPLVWALT